MHTLINSSIGKSQFTKISIYKPEKNSVIYEN